MRLKFNCHIITFVILSTIGIFYSGCSKNKSNENSFKAEEDSLLRYVNVVQSKTLLDKYWQLDYIKEWYESRIYPPAFNMNIDLKSKGIVDLWLLKNELFARNGFLFKDPVLRGYFKKFKWYQPIWDVKDFKVELSQQEYDFLKKIISLEKEKMKDVYVKSGNYKLINYNHVSNIVQFSNIPEQLKNSLIKSNFAIIPSTHEQLFYVYDKNLYEYIPNFITTDLFLQVLHKHLSSVMQNVEKEKLVVLLNDLLRELTAKNTIFLKSTEDNQKRSAAMWTQVYLAIASTLLTGQHTEVAPEVQDIYNAEMAKIAEESGLGSEYLSSYLIDYSQFKPRGNYTETEEMKRYFRCVKWLNSAQMFMDMDHSFLSSLMLAYFIKNSSEARSSYTRFSEIIKFMAGDEDNLSLSHMISILDNDYPEKDLEFIIRKENLDKIARDLRKMDPSRIKPKPGNARAANEYSRPYILFTAGRYNFDGEIFIRLVEISHPEGKRPFPKALDLFAVLGSQSAENILLNEYKEGYKWDGYTEELSKLKKQFRNGVNWNTNVYNKTMDAVISMQQRKREYPLFMQTHYWDKKNLLTSSAAWTELKHDMILYSEQPTASEAGAGEDGPPAPVHLSYVEPNTAFWSKAVELIMLQENTLKKHGLLTEKIKEINLALINLANQLLHISQKELRGESLTDNEFENLSWIGGEIESITFRILDNDHLPEREKQIALATDVYTYNSEVKNRRLTEAIGMADEIYVVAEINGRPYLTKGAVFSQYEFITENRLTDEEWQAMIRMGRIPKRPKWMDEIIVNTKSLNSRPEFSF